MQGTGLIPDPRSSHMPWSSLVCAESMLENLEAAITEARVP